jgi:hypothetical protein
VIFKNEQETTRIFNRILQSKNVEVLARFFVPLDFLDQFVFFYSKIAMVLKGDQCELVLKSFDIIKWKEKRNPSKQELIELYSHCLDALKAHENDSVAFGAHGRIFQDLIKSNLEEFLPEATRLVFGKLLDGFLPAATIKYIYLI